MPDCDTPAGVAVDAEHIYWTRVRTLADHAIGRANLDGTGRRPELHHRAGRTPAASGSASTQRTSTGPTQLRRLSGHDRARQPRRLWRRPDLHHRARLPRGVAVDAAHVYWTRVYAAPGTIGRANLDGSGVDQSFITDAGHFGAIAVNFSVGKLKKANNKGTAKLTLEVPAPGGIALAQTKKLKGAEVRAEAAGEVQLAIKPTGKAKKKLARTARSRSRSRSPTRPTAASRRRRPRR